MDYDLIVIGGGPAGYVGAIRAAQLGKKVVCVEMERAGGTCLNWGCIPTKALLKSAEIKQLLGHVGDYGLSLSGDVGFDFGKIMQRSRGVSDQMARGVEYLFKSKKVDYVVGKGQIESPADGPVKKVVVTGADGKTQTLTGKAVLICTGAKARPLPGVKVDGDKVLTSREALVVKTPPRSIIILGAGAIGCEFAYFFNAFGSKVTILEMLPQILPVEDAEVAEFLKRSFTKQGIEIFTDTKVEKTEVGDKGVKLTVAGGKTFEADHLLVAIGVEAQLDGLLGNGVKLELDRGYLKTNDRYETSVKGVYGAGDIIGPPWLAHVASHEAIEAVEGLFVPGKKPHKVAVFPGCTYCQPQVASVGLTEKAAKEKGLKYKVGKFPYKASGKAVAAGDSEGFVKVLLGEKHEEILGAHIIGADATELIAEYTLAMSSELTADEINATIHAHPTLAEMVHEAVLTAEGRPIHI
ncbi:MAG TPA: dihydrolipoyl dehydrogenase [Candidatus Methylacidiphilales bacterium]|jgi:dihydrolipoamide dehydrogenase|nr:dihydrolipoyl dehydrogenase [Candidatus Methylacidiphilales bacterium]